MDRILRPFFEEWYPRLVRYLRARMGDEDQAEDIAQEAFVRLLDQDPRDPAAWLFTVAANLAVDHSRVAGGRARHLSLIRADSAGSVDQGPEESLLRNERVACIRRALAALSDRDRDLLLLRHDGWCYSDIATKLGIAPSSVGSLLTRAQRRFASTFAEMNNDDLQASL